MELKETPKPKKSIFNAFLAKRSTKVEPHSFDDRNGTSFNIDDILHEQSSSRIQHPLHASVSANSTPMKRLYKIGKLNRLWHCHGSNLSLTSNHSIPSHFLRKTSHNTKKRIANTKDRHSHPISSTHDVFYVNDNSSNNDLIKRSKSLNPNQIQIQNQNQNRNHSNVAANNNNLSMHHNMSIERFDDDITKLGLSKSQEQIIVNDIDENTLCDSSKQWSPSSKSHDGTFSWNQNELDYPMGHSIAMSACRSRLREKLLPPGYMHKIQQINEQQQQQQQQNSSFANITNASNNKGDRSSGNEQRNTRSYSCDILQSAKRSGRTESLAKNSLMAAQLINLIPTEVARERSYLANNLAVNSLLGPAELDRILPLREIRVFVGTWNMNGQHPPKQMNDFVFPPGVEHVPDLVVIGTQESCSERFEWEVILQETLGPSHVMLHATNLGTLHLAVFIRRDLIWFCSIPEDDCLSVRPGTAFRTKGAVAISFCLFGTSMLFVTSHLTAHQQKVKERVSDVKRIIHALDLPKNLHLRSKNKDVTQNFDAVFWCGDLNFRLGEPREKLLKWIENTQFPLPSHLPHGYMHTDQLKSVLANGAAFKDFKEANITFPPTYKYDPGTQNFDTSSKRRAPAYTDRILFKYKSNPFGLRRESNITSFLHSAMVECISYDSVPSIVSSDHKPVWALFKTCIKPGIDSIPLAAGLFNRDVYIEGMKRRLTKKHTESTNACCIQ